jgi:hypothetical protein
VLEAFSPCNNGLYQTLRVSIKNEDYYNLIAAAEKNNPAKAKKG